MLIGFTVATLLYVALSSRFNITKMDALNLALFAAVGGVVGAKLLSILALLPAAIGELIQGGQPDFIAIVFLSGFVYWGGFLGGFGMVMFYLRRYKINKSAAFNAIAAPLAIGHGIGRVGCFFAGCCYGVPHTPGVTFQNSPIAPNGVSLLPTQLIEAGFNFLVGGVLLLLVIRGVLRDKLAYIYLIAYSIFRFVIEFFRGDSYRGFVFGLSTSQWISVFVLLATLIVIIGQVKKKHSRKS